jgi:hypothetical protein
MVKRPAPRRSFERLLGFWSKIFPYVESVLLVFSVALIRGIHQNLRIKGTYLAGFYGLTHFSNLPHLKTDTYGAQPASTPATVKRRPIRQ